MLSTSQEVLLDEETRDLPPDRLRRVLQDYETKTFFHMMGEARKERHEMERDEEDEQAGLVKRGLSRRARVRGPPTPSSASGQAKLNGKFQFELTTAGVLEELTSLGTVMAESVTALDHVEEDTHNDCDTDDIDTNEDDDNDSDTDDNLSSILSASAHGENAKPLCHGQREDPAQDRLDETSCWMKSFDWKAHSKIIDFVRHCWDLDNAKVSMTASFTMTHGGGADHSGPGSQAIPELQRYQVVSFTKDNTLWIRISIFCESL